MRLHFFSSAVIANSKMDYYATLTVKILPNSILQIFWRLQVSIKCEIRLKTQDCGDGKQQDQVVKRVVTLQLIYNTFIVTSQQSCLAVCIELTMCVKLIFFV